MIYNSDYKMAQFCNGTDWIAMSGVGASVLNGLGDTNVPSPADNDVLTYDSATGKWVTGTPGIGVETDPEVNTLTANKWCASNAGGTAIDCTQNAPVGDNLGAGGSGDLITDNTIDSTEIEDNTLTAADLAVDSVTASEIAASAVGASEIANGSVIATTELSATGTKNSTTFLRGDNTWAAPPGGGGASCGGQEHLTVRVYNGGPPNCTCGTDRNGTQQCQNGSWVGIQSKSCFTCLCLAPGTMIAMADGSFKIVEDVHVGDVLLGQDNAHNTVLALDFHELGDRQLYAINDGRNFVTEDHPLMTTKGWKSINPSLTARSTDMSVTSLEVGDILLTDEGDVLIKSITGADAPYDTTVYNFILDGNRTYYGDGYLVRPYNDKKTEAFFVK